MSIYNDASLIFYPSGYKAGTAYSLKPTDGSGDLTFTRASTATRVNESGLIELVAANVPRLDNSQGGCSTLLLEPQRTNLILRSEDFSNAYWIKSGSSVVSGFTSPDGTTNAFKLVEDTSTGRHETQAPSSSSGDLSISFFAKKGENSFIQITNSQDPVAYANFDLNFGVLGSSNIFTPTIIDYGNGWYRCIATINAPSAINFARIGLITSSTSARVESYTGDGTSGIYIYGAQLEANASYPTSYIPTTSTAVTRTQDSASKTPISSFLNTANPFTFYLNFERPDAIQSSTGYQMIGLDNGGYGQRIKLLNRGNQKQFTIEVYDGVTLSQTSAITNTPNIKVAIVYDGSTSYKVFHNGVLFQTLTNSATTLTRLISGENGTNYTKENYQSIMIFPTALSDDDLTLLTGTLGETYFESYALMANYLNYTIQ